MRASHRDRTNGGRVRVRLERGYFWILWATIGDAGSARHRVGNRIGQRRCQDFDVAIDNIFLFRKGTLDAPLQAWNGVAWVADKTTNAEWRVQFIWPLRVPYLIIDLDKDYQWSVIGYPNRKLAWVLSRQPTLDAAVYAGILERLAAQGYDTRLLKQVPQNLK